MSHPRTATAFAPASIGNLGVGFDMLGLAISGLGDHVKATRSDDPGMRLTVLDPAGNPHAELPSQAEQNTASIAAKSLWDEQGPDSGLELEIRKGTPLQSGTGSSAASAVAAVVAVNALLDQPLTNEALMKHALAGEAYASQSVHADNVAPSLFGGLVLCPKELLPRVIQLPTIPGVASVLLHPDLHVSTAESRKSLASEVSVESWLTQQGLLAGFIAACHRGDIELLAACLRDEIIEPQRKTAVPCFDAIKDAAMQNGAFGSSLSGSGPSVFALCNESHANEIAGAMTRACHAAGFECRTFVSPMDAPGASVVESS